MPKFNQSALRKEFQKTQLESIIKTWILSCSNSSFPQRGPEHPHLLNIWLFMLQLSILLSINSITDVYFRGVFFLSRVTKGSNTSRNNVFMSPYIGSSCDAAVLTCSARWHSTCYFCLVERHRKKKINAGINRIGELIPCSPALKQVSILSEVHTSFL